MLTLTDPRMAYGWNNRVVFSIWWYTTSYGAKYYRDAYDVANCCRELPTRVRMADADSN